MPNLDGLLNAFSAMSAVSDTIQASMPNLDGLHAATRRSDHGQTMLALRT